MAQTATHTELHIAPFRQPDGSTLARLTLTLSTRGAPTDDELATRASHIVRANQRLDHAERGYLLNCLSIGNYTIGTLDAAPTQHTPADTQPAPATAQHTPPAAPRIPSLNAADTPDGAATATYKPNPQYTGTAVLGIAAMHKSNLVPVFSHDQAIDTATMRRG